MFILVDNFMFKISKSLNKSYNSSYNLDYKNKVVKFHRHFLSRKKNRNVDLELVFQTLKTGKINPKKSRKNKLCIERYLGKINQTYVLILISHKNFVEVRTTWIRKGK